MSSNFQIRPIEPSDRAFVRAELIRLWCSPEIRSLDVPYQADELPGWVAVRGPEPLGHLTIFFGPQRCEIITLAAVAEGHGIGTALLAAAAAEARTRGYPRITLTTSNDNLRALAFYQKRGWRLLAVHPGMIDRYRIGDPRIPEIGLNGIPLRDEVELELPLT